MFFCAKEPSLQAVLTVCRTARQQGLFPKAQLAVCLARREQQQQAPGAKSGLSSALTREATLEALRSSCVELRFKALEFLCSSHRASEPALSAELGLVQEVLPYLCKTTQSNERGRLVHYLQRLLSRVRTSVNKIARERRHRPAEVPAPDTDADEDAGWCCSLDYLSM